MTASGQLEGLFKVEVEVQVPGPLRSKSMFVVPRALALALASARGARPWPLWPIRDGAIQIGKPTRNQEIAGGGSCTMLGTTRAATVTSSTSSYLRSRRGSCSEIEVIIRDFESGPGVFADDGAFAFGSRPGGILS